MAMQLLSWKQLREIVPLSRQHVWRLEQDGKFPKRLKTFGNHRTAKAFWVRAEIEHWINERLQAREAP